MMIQVQRDVTQNARIEIAFDAIYDRGITRDGGTTLTFFSGFSEYPETGVTDNWPLPDLLFTFHELFGRRYQKIHATGRRSASDHRRLPGHVLGSPYFQTALARDDWLENNK